MDYHIFHEIKRLHEQEKFSAYKIGLELGIDHKTVKRWIKRPKFEKRSGGREESVLKSYKKQIQIYLDRYDYSAIQLYDKIKETGYTGSLSTVRNYVRKVRPVRKKVFLTLNFASGEMAQVDFAYCGYIQLKTVRRRLYAFVMTLCYSRMTYVEFIMQQNQEHFLKCHRNAFSYFNGVPEKIMVDNCKVAVKKHPLYGEVELNPRYEDFARYYGFKIIPCTVRKPNQKGYVK
ncbi:MAG: IS21 family transposase [Candidatus Auribacterota bacterium]|nr:IS21 family transposase [Candidatus Auribacterota bacterium]